MVTSSGSLGGDGLMSFSTDLDAVRERAGLPKVHRLECRRHGKAEHLITIDPERVDRFIRQHALDTALKFLNPHVTYLEGPGRFRIKRFPVGAPTDPLWPWRVTDAERPGVFGRARTHAAAVELVGVMHARPGQAAQVLDEDDEVIAHVTGSLHGSPTATQWLHELEAARERPQYPEDEDWG